MGQSSKALSPGCLEGYLEVKVKRSSSSGDEANDAALEFREEDLPLKDDVNLLGGILGELLETLESKTLFAHVELARQAARERRAGDAEAETRLTRVLSGLEPDEGIGVTRAFSAYFGLVNMAERVHRIRRRRDYQRAGQAQPESFEAVLSALKSAGVEAPELSELLARLQFTPVFTAHPTEAVRRTLLTKEQRIAHALLARLDPARLTSAENEMLLEVVREELSIAWQTDEHFDAPSVRDEVEHVLFFLTQVVYSALPDAYAALGAAIDEVYGSDAVELPRRMVRFASWVGGDMDGNPNVDADTIRDTLARSRELIVRRYQAEVGELFEHLSQSRARIDPSPAVDETIEHYRTLLADAAANIPARYLDMPYRVLAMLVTARLGATLTERPGAYVNPAEFGADLRLMLEAMAGHGHTGAERVRRLALKVDIFGFHLATLDVRQDSAVHRDALGEALALPSFPSLPVEERLERLREALAGQLESRGPVPGGALERCLRTMRAIGEARARYGADAVGPYIVSMTEGPDDALAVLLLGRLAGLVLDDGVTVPVDIAPLFETVDDLERAAATLDTLLAEPLYREHVRQRGGNQVVMIGYSDSNKESGIAASRWALHDAQLALVASTRSAPGGAVDLTLFHGRGGTISRGGGKPRAGILGEPPGVLGGQLRVTEQGEIIAQKYGLADIALRTIEMTTGALLERTVLQRIGTPEQPDWHEAAKVVAVRSREAYRSLVYDDAAFVAYFRAATPIDVIERMRIGSRPPARRSAVGVENLRAIPWVFAWTQSRHNLPGWYGVGTGLAALLEAMPIEAVRVLARDWRFFGNLLDDAEMVIAKTDMSIASHYADLAGEAGKPVFTTLLKEFERTRHHICAIREIDEVLDDDPVLKRNIQLRNPYVDPMSLVQVDFLRRWRETERSDDVLLEVLMTTIRGIARGMQNTG